ncbi:MAG TPA: crosslink repair DNA glycosylase YcaQ family protein [Candidatus Angelobacter sp.]|nr:crosslink repair DNA glycosylase YcaQ family protein [Candidatus Angelobacter sp.]
MTELELQQQRSYLWHTDGKPVRTIEDAVAFVDSVGLCLMYPDRSLSQVPTFMGAYAGSAERLPDVKHAFADPRAKEAIGLMVRLLRQRAAFEATLNAGETLLISAGMFPYFYALVSDRNPRAVPRARSQGISFSPLALTVFEAIQKHGPASKNQLREICGRALSDAGLDRALHELWSILKITRVDYREDQGAFWDVLYRWAPEQLKQGLDISAPEAVSALLSKHLEAVVAADEQEIEDLFSRFTSRSKVREATKALLAARELSFVTVGGKSLIRMSPVAESQRSRVHG